MGVEQSDFLRAFERLDEMKIELKLNSQIVWGLLRDLDKNEDWIESKLTNCLRTFELKLNSQIVGGRGQCGFPQRGNCQIQWGPRQGNFAKANYKVISRNKEESNKWKILQLGTILNHIQAMAINVGAVFSVVELAKKMKNLKALIHVSTAYCNTHLAWWEMIRESFLK